MSDRLVVVHTVAGHFQANLIKSLLEAADIPALLSQESAGTTYGFTVGTMGIVDILVPEQDAARAQEIIAALDDDAAADEGEGLEPPDEP